MKRKGTSTLPNKQGLFHSFKTVRLLSFLISFLSILICFLGWGTHNKVEATNYYVDSSITDTNPASATPDCTNYNTSTYACSGGSASAYTTIADINAGSFSPDDQILFRKGQTWREQLRVPSSGTNGDPITFGAYGNSGDPKPIISGSDSITGMTSEAVGAITKVQGTLAYTNSADSANRTYATTPVQGDLLIAVGQGTTTIGNASMSGSGWTLAVSALQGSTATLGIWYKIAGAGEPTSVTLSWTSSTLTGLAISEYSGIDATPLDKFAHTDTTGGAVTSRSSGTTATTTVANELLYTAFGMGAAVSAESYSNSFTEDFNASTTYTFFGATKIVSATGAYETTESWTTSRVAGGIIATFKGAGGTSFTAYKKHLSGLTPLQVFQNGVRIPRVATKLDLTAGTWYWDTATSYLYVRTTGDDDPSGYTIEASVRSWGIDAITNHVSNITIQDLELKHAKNYNIQADRDNVTVQRCSVHDAFIHNISFGSATASVSPAVYDCDIYGAGANGIMLYANISGVRIQRNTVHENSNLNNTMVGSNSEQLSSGGIKMYVGPGMDATAGSDTLITDNTVYNNGPSSWVTPDGNEGNRSVGIWLDYVRVPTLTPAYVRYNTIYGNANFGIYLEKTQRCGAEYNRIYNNASLSYSGNLGFGANSGTSSLGGWAYNNIIYGTGWSAMYMDGTSSLTNALVKNNIIAPTSGYLIYVQANGVDVSSGNILDYNIYGTGVTFDIDATNGTLGAAYSTIASWKTASGQDAHSMNTDPLFTNPSSSDFTLQSSSPAINAGVDVGLTTDYAGGTVPQGAAPDIGAYEYGSEMSAPENIWMFFPIFMALPKLLFILQNKNGRKRLWLLILKGKFKTILKELYSPYLFLWELVKAKTASALHK